MANADPTGGGERAVPISIPPKQAQILRRELAGFKSDLEADARAHPDGADAPRWLSEIDAYGRLIAGLDAGEIVPDDQVRQLVREWAKAHDDAEHYEQVVLKHDALHALRVQIGAQ